VIIHGNLDKPSVIKAEHLNIRSLDMNNVVIISTVMAQTVALDYYAESVDRMLDAFIKMNQKIQDTGSVNDLSATSLHKMVAVNNSVITNVLSKVGYSSYLLHLTLLVCTVVPLASLYTSHTSPILLT
jgi:hypothetical protein